MFKFSENILKLSSSSDIDEAIKEWLFIDEGQTKEAENTCICQKKIKNFNYMYNYKTKKTILVGSSCFKKFNFSEKEIKILRLIADDKTTEEISKEVFLSPRTIETIRQNMKTKAGARTVAGLVMYAIRNKLLD